MPADLRLVVDAAEGDAGELPPQRAGDGAADGGLADTGRTDEAEDGPSAVLLELADGQELHHSLFHVTQPVMVFVENALSTLDVQAVARPLAPRQRDHPIEVGADHGDFRSDRRHPFQSLHLVKCLLMGFLRHPRRLDLLAQIAELFRVGVPLPELFLDRAHPLAQEVLLLAFTDLAPHSAVDLLIELQDLHLPGEVHTDLGETFRRRADLEDSLLVGQLQVEIRDNHVGQSPRIRRSRGALQGFRRNRPAQLNDLVELG